jgi:hypothetical protein
VTLASCSAPVRQCLRAYSRLRRTACTPDRELILEDARSICESLWRMARLAQDTAESLDARIEDENLDGKEEAVEVREALERLQD